MLSNEIFIEYVQVGIFRSIDSKAWPAGPLAASLGHWSLKRRKIIRSAVTVLKSL